MRNDIDITPLFHSPLTHTRTHTHTHTHTHTTPQVVLLFSESNSLRDLLQQQCQGLTHDHVLVTTAEEAWQRVSRSSRQSVLLVDISTNQIAAVENLMQLLNSYHFWLQTTLVAVSDSNQYVSCL